MVKYFVLFAIAFCGLCSLASGAPADNTQSGITVDSGPQTKPNSGNKTIMIPPTMQAGRPTTTTTTTENETDTPPSMETTTMRSNENSTTENQTIMPNSGNKTTMTPPTTQAGRSTTTENGTDTPPSMATTTMSNENSSTENQTIIPNPNDSSSQQPPINSPVAWLIPGYYLPPFSFDSYNRERSDNYGETFVEETYQTITTYKRVFKKSLDSNKDYVSEISGGNY